MNKKYCYNCDDFVYYYIKNIYMNLKIKNKDISFYIDRAFCNICNEHVYIIELENNIIKKAYQIYKQKEELEHELIHEMIKERNKKDTGKRYSLDDLKGKLKR
jgi:hypothetical protein